MRNNLIKMIHIAKNNAKVCTLCNRIFYSHTRCPKCRNKEFLPLSDKRYREILSSITSKSSSSKMNEEELEAVLDFFIKAGWKPIKKISNPKQDIEDGNRGTIKTIYGRGKAVLGPTYQSRIEGFVKIKFDKNSLYKCTKKELRTVIGWINRLAKRR